MKKDLVIGIVGTLILLTAMVGVFRYEAAQRSASFDVAWPTRLVEGDAEQGGTNEGEETPVPVTISRENVTRVEWVLEWTDNVANSGPDRFELVVTSPAGQSQTAPGAEGRVSVVFDNLSLVPEPMRVSGASEQDAAAKTRQFRSVAATGVWNVTVRLLDAGDVAAVAPAGTPLQDGGNEWTLKPVMTVYEARLARA